ncbi:2-oxoglutarate and iron-dependent oxygenase JMJD4-like isoform X2 [Uloborus diversus]|uniref:2-oxoglutarate and iron-dependent oxygenase JMJD4-like isoform X2 n=1 Tax=Uloborus diversus TaxID=327109 RepID=UPI002409B867|nr:2-oxoglutarate and iron-dependent oxygenase JMJD4-like isoform X2 [Uloborus diversus]
MELSYKSISSADVPVADCGIKDYNSQLKSNMKFKDYIKYWKKLNQETNNCPSLYLKDWHFNRNFPKYGAYVTPIFFKSDWLNEFCQKENDDYEFVYMGPKGTWTPLHADVFGSYSWSVNICGRKRWLLFPPGTEKLLQNEFKQLIYNVELTDIIEKKVQHLDVIQETGEIIFVPSGWHHQVWNLEDTISINHNWFNGCNINYIWKCLYKAALDVKKEIDDCKEDDHFEEQMQLMLKVHHGMNYEEFLKILNFIFKSRESSIQNHHCNASSYWQQVFDIVCVRNVCRDMMKNELPSCVLECIKNLQNITKEFLCKETNVISR